MDNTPKQNVAVNAIQRISNEADMFVFMLVDEDLFMVDGGETLTEDEKSEVWDTMNERILDAYHEMLRQAVQDVIDSRDA